MTIAALGDGWFDEAVAATIDADVMAAVSIEAELIVRNDNGQPTPTRMLFTEGSLVSWQLARAHEPDVAVVVDHDAFGALIGARPALSDPRRVNALPAVGVRCSIPPKPEELAVTTAPLTIAEASLTLAVTFDDDPITSGATYRYGFCDGRAVRFEALEGRDVPHVDLNAPYVAGVGYLLGQIPFREFAARADTGRDVFALAAVTGLLAPSGLPPAEALDGVISAAVVLAAIRDLRQSWPAPPAIWDYDAASFDSCEGDAR